MDTTIKIQDIMEIKKAGTDALLRALGPVGMVRYLEQFDNGGQGDYTKEKYQQPEHTIDDIVNSLK